MFTSLLLDCNYPAADWTNDAALGTLHRTIDLQTESNCGDYVDDCLASAQDGDYGFSASCQGKLS